MFPLIRGIEACPDGTRLLIDWYEDDPGDDRYATPILNDQWVVPIRLSDLQQADVDAAIVTLRDIRVAEREMRENPPAPARTEVRQMIGHVRRITPDGKTARISTPRREQAS